MNETSLLDMLGKAGDAAPKTVPRKKGPSSDFASQFMAMLFEDPASGQAIRTGQGGRAKASSTRTAGGTPTTHAGSDRSETDPKQEEARPIGEISDRPVLPGTGADLLARRFLSGAFETEDSQSSPAAAAVTKKTDREATGEDAESEEATAAGPQSGKGAKVKPAAAEPEQAERGSETSRQKVVPSQGRRGGGFAQTGLEPEAGAAHSRKAESDEQPSKVIPVGGKDETPARESTTPEPGTRRTAAGVESKQAGIRPFVGQASDGGDALHSVSPHRESARDLRSAHWTTPTRTETKDFAHLGVSRQTPETDREDSSLARAERIADRLRVVEPEASDRAASAEGRADHLKTEESPNQTWTARSGDPRATQPILQSLGAVLSKDSVTRRSRSPQIDVSDLKKLDENRNESTSKSGKVRDQARFDAAGMRTPHGRTVASRHDARPNASAGEKSASAGENDGRTPSSGDDGSRADARRAEVDSVDMRRHEVETSRTAHSSRTIHETASGKESTHTDTEMISATPIKGDSPTASVRAGGGHASQTAASAPDFGKIVNQIVGNARLEHVGGFDRFTVQLRPEFLGRIEIQTELSDDATLRAVIRVEDPSVRKAVESGLMHLVSKLNELGLDIASARVADFLPQNDGQGRQQSDSSSSFSPRSRAGVTVSTEEFSTGGEVEEGSVGFDDGTFSYFA